MTSKGGIIMPKPITNKFFATRIFTDRQEPQQAFLFEYEYLKRNKGDYSLLQYYGVGGIGKTSLLHHLEKKFFLNDNKKENIGRYYLKYDFDISTDIRTILTSWRNLLVKLDNQFKFKYFDIGCLIYAEILGDSNIMLTEEKNILETNPIIKILIDVEHFVPGASTCADILNAVNSSSDNILSLAEKRKINNLRQELKEMSTEERIRKLVDLFSFDLAFSLQKTKEPLVIFLDTYEKLVNNLEKEYKYEEDWWIKDITHGIMCHVPNVLWVIFGREKINYPWQLMGFNTLPIGKTLDEVDSPNEYIESKLHMLGNLADNDARSFLINASVPEIYHGEIINISQGNPLWLDVSVNAYENSVNSNINFELSGIESAEGLVKRYLKYMDNQMQDVVKQLAVIGRWTFDSRSKILIEKGETACEKIEKSCFVKQENRKNIMHELMRKTLYKICIEEKFCLIEEIYNKACNYYSERLNNAEINLQDYISILEDFVDLYEFVVDYEYPFEKIIIYIENIMNSLFCRNILGLVYKIRNRVFSLYGEESNEALKCNRLLAAIYCENENFSMAIKLDETNLQYCLKNFGLEKEETWDCIWELIYALNSNKQYEEVVKQWENFFSKNEKIIDKYLEHNIDIFPNAMFEVGKINEAMNLATRIIEKLKEKPTANLFLRIIDLSELYCKNNLCIEAKGLVDYAEEIVLPNIYSLISDSEKFKIENGLAEIYYKLENYEETNNHLAKALDISISLEGEFSLKTFTCSLNMILLLIHTAKYEEALRMSIAHTEVTTEVLGESHEVTIQGMRLQALSYLKLNHNKKAMDIYTRILGIQKELYGLEHPETIGTMIDLAEDNDEKKAIGYLKEAYNISAKIYPYNLETKNLLYKLYLRSNKKEQEKLYEQAGKDYVETINKYGENHPYTELKFTSFLRLRLYNILTSSMINESDPDVLLSAHMTALSCYQEQNYLDAIEIQETIYEIARKFLPEESEILLNYRYVLSRFYETVKDYEKATLLCEENLNTYKNEYGETDSNVIDTTFFLFTLYLGKKDYKKAIGIGEDFYKKYHEILGDSHEYIIKISEQLEKCYKDVKND